MIKTKQKRPVKNHVVRVPAIRCIQNNTVMYLASIPNSLLKHYKFDIHDPQTGKGYNRDEALKKRGVKVEKDLQKENSYSPTAIAVNDRTHSVKIRPTKDPRMFYLEFDQKSKMYVIDGQSRTIAFDNLFKKGILEDVPTILTQKKKADEIISCATINNKQIKCQPRQRYAWAYNEVLCSLKEGKSIKDMNRKTLITAIGYNVVRMINNDKTSCLYGHFTMAGENPQSQKERLTKVYDGQVLDNTINYRTLTLSCHLHEANLYAFIKQYLDENIEKCDDFEGICINVFHVVNNFWEALKSINSKIFSVVKTIYKGKSKIALVVGYHTLRQKGCFTLYPLMRSMFFDHGIKTKNGFAAALSRSKRFSDPERWEENKMNRKGMHIVCSDIWAYERSDIYEEIFPSKKS